MHLTSEPAILYFGTPVVLISTVNEDGSYNLALMSSAFWLGWRCVLGLSAFSKTTMKNVLIDRFIVSSAAVAEFTARLKRIAALLRTQPGLMQHAVHHSTAVDGQLEMVTVAVWANEQAIQRAQAVIQAAH